MTTEKLVCERLCIDFCNKYEEQKSTIRELEARIAALTKDAEPATTCPRIELVVAIHSLASDFENMSYSFGADTEDRKRAQGSIKHAMAVANKHNQNGAGCITHPPAPKAITADMVTDEMVDAVEDAIGMGRGAWDMVDHKELIAAACKTIGQAPIALALLTIDEVRTAYINANNDGFDFEGQLQKAFCKKNGLPHPTE